MAAVSPVNWLVVRAVRAPWLRRAQLKMPATPPSTALLMNRIVMMPVALMPARVAATGLPPMRVTFMPKADLDMMSP